MTESINHQRRQKKSHIDDPDLLKLMIKLFSKKLIHKKLTSPSSTASLPIVSNPTSPASTSSKSHRDVVDTAVTVTAPLKMSQERQAQSAKTTSPSTHHSPHHQRHHHHHHHHKDHHHAAKKLKNLEQDLIRVEYYNDFNSCLSLSQTLSALNPSGPIETGLKLRTPSPSVIGGEGNVGGCVGAAITPREHNKEQSQTTRSSLVTETKQTSEFLLKNQQQNQHQKHNTQAQQQQPPVNNEKRPSDFFELSSSQR